jgi:hypothetical protein
MEIASQGVPLLARRPISSEKKARFIHSVQVLCCSPIVLVLVLVLVLDFLFLGRFLIA